METPNQNSNIKHIILVLSGKGGVGKSTVSIKLALGLKEKGFKVGLLDTDLCGPSIPTVLQIEGKSVYQCNEGWVPVYMDEEKRLVVMSIGFFLNNRNDAVIWRGPKKNAMIGQFVRDVYWGGLDYLVIDTPPGTSDEHMSVVQAVKPLNPDGVVLVTTPQTAAVADVRREVTFCKKVGLNIIGVVENMSGFTCPHCQECTNIFSKGGGQSLAEYFQIPFLGSVPICPTLSGGMGGGGVDELQKSVTSQSFKDILEKVIATTQSDPQSGQD